MTPAELREARKTLGLDRSELAALVGYSNPNRITEIESGARNPGAAVERLIKAYLDGYRPADWPSEARSA